MRTFLAAASLSVALIAPPARAVEAHYEAYAAGVAVLDMRATWDVMEAQYRVRIAFRTLGAVNLLARSMTESVAEGRFAGARPVPTSFRSSGTLRGEPRATAIDYPGGQPVVRQLVPAPEAERERVPETQQADTVDSLSAMAELVRQVNRTGRCEGQVTTFDGRRLSTLSARTEGPQVLEPSSRSAFSGPTLRCAFVGRQLAGFMLDEDRAKLARPQEGTAWFGQVEPGGPMIPVRIAFRTRWFGEATMYWIGAS